MPMNPPFSSYEQVSHNCAEWGQAKGMIMIKVTVALYGNIMMAYWHLHVCLQYKEATLQLQPSKLLAHATKQPRRAQDPDPGKQDCRGRPAGPPGTNVPKR